MESEIKLETLLSKSTYKYEQSFEVKFELQDFLLEV